MSTSESTTGRRALADAGRTAEMHEYPGTHHWFAESDRPEFEPAAAGLAWERTIQFFHQNMTARKGSSQWR